MNYNDLSYNQKSAVDVKGTALVTAAAGSGKTAVLTERVIKLISDGDTPIDIDKLLIVTFTRGAAAEMRSRISEKLVDRLNLEPNNNRLRKQQLLINGAKICTIDSFCIDLVKENFDKLNIEPDFKIIDENSFNVSKRKVAANLLELYFSNSKNQNSSLTKLFSLENGNDELINTIINIYTYSRCLPFPKTWLRNSSKKYLNSETAKDDYYAQHIIDSVKNELKNAKPVLVSVCKKIENCKFYTKVKDKLDKQIKTIDSVLDNATKYDWDNIFDAINGYESVALTRFNEFKTISDYISIDFYVKQVTSSIKKCKELVCDRWEFIKQAHRQSAENVIELCALVEQFSDMLEEYCREVNAYTFDMIEHLAFNLLYKEENGSIVYSETAKKLSEKFNEVLVDEYQDVNALQDSIFYAISGEGKHLFMVGDVKQSIYGFRNANPDIFLNKRDTFITFSENTMGRDTKIILDANYRSRKGICDFTNFIFSLVMEKGVSGMNYGEEDSLKNHASFPENGEKSDSELHILNLNDSQLNIYEAEAQYIAGYIKSIVGKKILRDKENNLREVKYGDIAILMRSLKNIAHIYVNAFKKAGIPIDFESGTFYNSEEIVTAVSYLSVISNPTRDIPLLSLMFSSLYSFTADELANLRLLGKGSLFSLLNIAAKNGNKKCINLLDDINYFRYVSITTTITDLIRLLYKKTDLHILASVNSDGIRRRDNLNKLLELSENFLLSNDNNIGSFVEYFNKLAEKSKDKNEIFETHSEDTVKLVSIHSSKGLQYPICVLAANGKSVNFTDTYRSVLMDEFFGIGAKYVDKYNHMCDTVARQTISLNQRRKIISEELRLLYVAMTRAEEKLIIILSSKNLEKTINSLVSNLAISGLNDGRLTEKYIMSLNSISNVIFSASLLHKNAEILRNMCEINLPLVNNSYNDLQIKIIDNYLPIETESDKDIIKIMPNEDIIKEISDVLNYQYPYSDSLEIKTKMSVTEIVGAESDDYAFNSLPQFLNDGKLTPAQKGTATHKFFQFADFSLAENSVKNELERLVEWEFLSEVEANSINIESITKFFEHDIYQRIKNSKQVNREQKFITEHIVKGESVIIQGIADCVFVEEGKLVILDFKTDNVKDINELPLKYTKQLEIYASALSKVFGLEVKECIIYSLKFNDTVKCII